MKQYLLLAGREEKYRKMYLKTIDAVRQWMLYRPMIPGNRDILFSGAVTTEGKPETDLKLTAEVEHLTCFIGGMVGMGAKIFGLEGDLELAKKLADGCVWAYESTASGIMPEGATVYPCKSAESCTWNETAYMEFLDPLGKDRDNILQEYIQNKAEMDAEKARAAEAAAKKAEEDRIAAQEALDTASTLPDEDFARHEAKAADIPPERQAEDIAKYEKTKSAALYSSTHTTEPAPTSNPVSLEKRQSSLKDDLPKPITHNFKDDVAQAKENYKKETAKDPGALQGVSSPPEVVMPQDKMYMEKVLTTEAELRGLHAGRQAETPLSEQHSPTPTEDLPDPLRPLSHQEFVEARVKQENLPPGFVTIRGRKYILR